MRGRGQGGIASCCAGHSSPPAAHPASLQTWLPAADTTVGLLLTICLHKAALRAAHWYGERHSQRYGQPLQLETADGGGGTTVAAAAGEPWFAALQLCGNYGAPACNLLQLAATVRAGTAAECVCWDDCCSECFASMPSCCCRMLPPALSLEQCVACAACTAGDPPSYRRWSIQLGEWVGCVVLARVLCGTLVLLLGQLLVHVAQVRALAGLCWWVCCRELLAAEQYLCAALRLTVVVWGPIAAGPVFLRLPCPASAMLLVPGLRPPVSWAPHCCCSSRARLLRPFILIVHSSQ